MRHHTRCLLAAGAILHALVLPALADSVPYPLSGTWQKIASAGTTIQVQASGASITLTTATGTPANAAGQNLLVGQSALTMTLAQDLWALSNGGGIAVVTAGLGGGGQSASPAPITITSAEWAVPAATSTALNVANSARRFLSLTNDGTSPCRVAYGVAASASTGEPLAAAAAQNGQGGARTFDAGAVTQQALFAYCPTAGSIAVLEGQ